MRHLFFLSSLLFSTFLFAQQTLRERQIEENLFIIKLIGVIILILVVMPFALGKIREMAPKPKKPKRVPFVEPEDVSKKKRKKVAPKKEEEEEYVDPLIVETEALLYEKGVTIDEHDRLAPLYRRYLQIQKGQLEIQTGSFDFNTALDTVMTKVHSLENDRNFEIVFDIDANVPSKIIGDAERLEEILFYVIKNVVLRSNAYLIKLSIKRLNLGDNALHLEFYIPYAIDNYEEEKLDIFTPFANGDKEISLELYMAKAYAMLMHGDITFDVKAENDSAFIIHVQAYMPNPSELRHYRLPSKTMIGHSVLIVDDHNESAVAVKKMFEYFKNEVDVLSSKEMFLALEMLDDYDIVVIQERYFTRHLNAKLNEIKSNRMIKVVSLNKNEGFKHSDDVTITLLDGELAKPVTVQKVFDLLVALYQEA